MKKNALIRKMQLNFNSKAWMRNLPRLLLLTILSLFLACTSPTTADSAYELKKAGTTVAVIHCDYSPVSYWDKNTNKPAGFFVDIMNSLAHEKGLQMNYICKNGWPEMIEAIEQGEADLGSLMKSKEREKKLLFTAPVEISYLSFFARSKDSVDADNLPADHTVGVIKGSMSYEQMKKRHGIKLAVQGSYKEGIFSLLAGEIGLFAGEESTILKHARETGLEDHIKRVGKPFSEHERGLAVHKENTQLHALLNNVIPEFIKSPAYQQAYLKWYGKPTPYWTNKRIFTVSGMLFFTVIFCMALWRYISVSRINENLVRSTAERKKAEADALISKERLARAQTIAHVGDWEWDIATNNVLWSDELYHIYGFEPRSISPDYGLVLSQMHPASKDKFLTAIDAALKEDRHFEMDYRFFRKNGAEAILHTIGKVIRDESGTPLRMVGIVQDITERKEIEVRFLESEYRFRSIFDKALDGIMIADTGTRKQIEANSAICNMLGYTRDEILSLNVEDLHPKEDLPRVLDIFKQQVHGGLSLAPDIPMLRKDGSVVYTDINATSVTLGGKQCLIGIFRDITARKQAEEKIRQSEEFIKNILNTVDEGFIVIDRDYHIINANKAYCGQVSLPSEEVIGRHCYELSHKTDRPCYEEGEECAVQHVFKTGIPHSALHKHTSHNGNTLYVETKAYPIRDASGNVISAIETINNITEKHLLEEERLKTQKLESISTLAGGIAHDFNNLLQGIFGFISLAKINLDQKQKCLYMLEQSEKALHTSVNLTTQLLTFAKGGKPLRKKIKLLPVIENSAKFALSGSKIDYSFQIEEELRPVEADEGQISQVIQNIVLNADQSMPMGGTIKIAARNVQSPRQGLPPILPAGGYVEISIKDSGIGIPEQYLTKIFDPYFTTKDKGSGLGLATSYSIIKNHGGLIDVKSSMGRGSTFFIYLPALEAEYEKAEAVASGSLAVRKCRVLLMDDEEMVRDTAEEMIRTLGHEVEFAENGEEVIAKYTDSVNSGRKFDIVILDLTIRGGMGGEETIRKLLDIDPSVKAVVSSGYADNTIISEYISHGFRTCLTKPYSIHALNNMLNTMIK